MLIKTREYDTHAARYIPGAIDVVFQGIVQKLSTIEQRAHPSYKDKEALDFELTLYRNCYTNVKSPLICFAIQFRKITNADASLYDDNFFAQWIKEIDISNMGQIIHLFRQQLHNRFTDIQNLCLNICLKRL